MSTVSIHAPVRGCDRLLQNSSKNNTLQVVLREPRISRTI